MTVGDDDTDRTRVGGAGDWTAVFRKPSFARDHGINWETVYQYLRHAKLE